MEDTFELYNNQLVQQLIGPQDSNLKLIENMLESIYARPEEVENTVKKMKLPDGEKK